MKNKTCEIEISTFRGMAFNAKHYYGKIIFHDTYSSEELLRPITNDEIETNPDRMYRYEPGDMVNFFETWRDVIKAGVDFLKQKNIFDETRCIVSGIPNNDSVSLDYALSDKVDTRLKCSICGNVITGVCYNMPSGVQCVDCHNKHKK